MATRKVRSIVEFLYANFPSEKTLVHDLIQEHITVIKDLSSKDEEWIYDHYIQPFTDSYNQLVDELHLLIEQKQPICNIQIINGAAGYYIAPSQIGNSTCSTFRDNADIAFKKILLLNNNTKKGLIFERFCIALLRDLGVDTKPTKVSNDKGADIFGFIKNDKSDLKYKYIFDTDVLLLCQCKLFSKPIDTPVIRKLVGDSLFIRFSEIDYIELRHNALHLMVFSYSGFTQPAKEFSKQNKIKLLDFEDIVAVAGALPNLNKTRIKRYLYILNSFL